jgi:hypothetical protein
VPYEVPLEFKDDATGEHFDVVQDDDFSPDPSEEPDDQAHGHPTCPDPGRSLTRRRARCWA